MQVAVISLYLVKVQWFLSMVHAGISESKGGSSIASTEAGFSPVQLVAIEGVVQKVLSENRPEGQKAEPPGAAQRKAIWWS